MSVTNIKANYVNVLEGPNSNLLCVLFYVCMREWVHLCVLKYEHGVPLNYLAAVT